MLEFASVRDLAVWLGRSEDSLIRLSETANRYYRRKEIPKKDEDGAPRVENGQTITRAIDASHGPLKEVQRQLKIWLDGIPLSPSVYGVTGKGHVHHARMHLGKKYHFKVDIKDFFPSISRNSVRRALVRAGVVLGVAEVLSRLTTYNGRVPQGAPTSSHISNVRFREIDRRLDEFCGRRGIVYSRFADDLLFSSGSDFADEIHKIIGVVQAGGFKCHRDKMAYKVGPLKATGISIRNNGLALDSRFFERLEDPDLPDDARLGTIQYIQQVTGYT